MTAPQMLGTAAALLRQLHIRGSVEARSSYQYGRETLAIGNAIKRNVPARFGSIDVFLEIYTGKLMCPRVHIEVGVRGQVAPAVIKWASGEVRRYGRDRVEYRFFAEGKLD